LGIESFHDLLEAIHQKCLEYSLSHTSELAKRSIDRLPPATYAEMFSELNHLNDSLSNELQKEAVFRVPPSVRTILSGILGQKLPPRLHLVIVTLSARRKL
jgi:hypothetical protein